MILKEILNSYKKQNLAIPAFNIDCFVTFQALEEVLLETKTPFIAQLSPRELEFIKPQRLFALKKLLSNQHLPIFLNVDHGRNPDLLKEIIDLGFDMVHFDGSDLSLEDNLKLTKELVSYAHQRKVLIEVEIDGIKDTKGHPTSKNFTHPPTALNFIAETKADLFAVSVGNIHGVPSTGFESVNLDLLDQISQALPGTFLTMHGGSGINPEDLKKSLRLGIVKVNINTDLRTAFRSSLENTLNSDKSIKAYHLLTPSIQALKTVIQKKLTFFSSDHV